VIERRNGSVVPLEADWLLLAGRVSALPDLGGMPETVQRVYEIGDCRGPRGVAEALDEARAIVATITA
jgi:hypothetical protein